MSLPRCPRCGATTGGGERLALCPACLLDEPAEPALIGDRFELSEEIGRGASGTVYRARDRRLDRDVAVKILDRVLAADGHARARFEREARLLSRLRHPRIAMLLDAGIEEDEPYLVMELVGGGTLAEHLPLEPGAAVARVIEVLEGLEAAHATGIVHRDVKPSNVLLDEDGGARIGDFGISRSDGGRDDTGGTGLTRGGMAIGTPAFMAPEAMVGAAPDPRMDIYSAGALLYACITGTPPAGDFAALPGRLDGIVRRALAPDPARRHASAAELRRDLERARGAGDALPSEERAAVAACALALTLATAVALWAGLESLTPRVMDASDVGPLVMIEPEPLPGGRVVVLARFALWPTLAAVAAFAGAALAYGSLRRRWRRRGLDRPRPQEPVPAARAMLSIGVALSALYALAPRTSWTPVLGGLMELAAVVVFWVFVLDVARRRRDPRREPLAWIGVSLALVPPVLELWSYRQGWVPAP